MTTAMPEPHSWAEIDLQALTHNLGRVRELAPGKRICAVIKANAYGHGVHEVAAALAPLLQDGDLVSVATLQEALTLRQRFTQRPVLVLRGPINEGELALMVEQGLHWMMHSPRQADLLRKWLIKASAGADSGVDTESSVNTESGVNTKPPVLNIWLKLNTGMNRLGMSLEQLQPVWQWLQSLALPGERVLVSHFATADETLHPLALQQLQRFEQMTAALPGADGCARSLSASAGILCWPQAHHQIVRPGIMLYGASPRGDRDGHSDGLQPVMSLKSRLLTVNQLKAGDSVGYGAAYHCAQDMTVGVVGIGYGDGYPRHLPSGTPVLIHAQGKVWEATLAGRVSMDMITVDLTNIPASAGDEVLLWGRSWGAELPADRIARYAGTIAYELFCQITSRVQFRWLK